MTSILVIVQFALVAIICICVLLQKSSNIGLGAYSGSNESLFGAKGPAGFLAKFTFIIGFLFLLNTLTLGYLYNKPSSIVEDMKNLPQSELPKAPKAAPLPAAKAFENLVPKAPSKSPLETKALKSTPLKSEENSSKTQK